MKGCFGVAILLICGIAAAHPMTVRVVPASATACVRHVRSAENVTCASAQNGNVTMTVSESADIDANEVFVDFRATGHFPQTIAAVDLHDGMVIRLTAYPHFRWNGWEGGHQPRTRLQWMPVNGSQWQDLAAVSAPADVIVPGEFLAVRAIPENGATPHTIFARAPRESVTAGPLSLADGGEVALCLSKPRYEPHERHSVSVHAGSAVLQRHDADAGGCISFPSLTAGRVTITVEGHEFESGPVAVHIDAGKSAWLGAVPLQRFSLLRVRVNDPDRRHRYLLAVRPVSYVPENGEPAARELTSSDEVAYPIAPGAYSVSLRADFASGFELQQDVTVANEVEIPIEFQPRFVMLFGTVRRGDAVQGGVSIRFEREGTPFLDATATAGQDGAFEVLLPSDGAWQAYLTRDGQQTWRPDGIRALIPYVSRFQWDIALPDGRIEGRVVDGDSGKGIGRISVEASWRRPNAERAMVISRTDDSGTFAMDSVPEGDVRVSVPEEFARPLGYSSGPVQTAHVRNTGVTRVALTLRRHTDATSIEVVDGEARPTAQVRAFVAVRGGNSNLIGISDARGRIDVPDDLALPVVLYLVSSGHPWQRATVVPDRDMPTQRVVLLPEQAGVSAILVGGVHDEDGRPSIWTLIDEDGFEVPLLYHLLAQGVLPEFRDGQITIPNAGRGTYALLRTSGGVPQQIGTVILPSSTPVLLQVPR